MSWDADLELASGRYTLREFNYTHNTNGMIAAAIEDAGLGETPQCAGPLGPAIGPAWWNRLDGRTGVEGKQLLAAIILALEAKPEKYRAMNPENGWGSYDSLLTVLRDMHDCVPEEPTVWRVSG